MIRIIPATRRPGTRRVIVVTLEALSLVAFLGMIFLYMIALTPTV